MSQSQIILLVLAVVGVVFGIGVIFIGRRAKPAPRTTIAQERATTTVADKPVEATVITEPVVSAPVVEEPVAVEPVVEEPVTRSVRDRLSKARGALLDDLRGRVKAKELTTPHEVIGALRSTMKLRLAGASRDLTFDSSLEGPNIWLMVGVNGAGKTTSLGKIAAQQVAAGRRVVMAAGDTFRAAAGEQLATWAERSGAEIVRGAEGGDPSSVIFDAVQSAGARGADLVLADTAGRLQSNTNLMEELRKVRRVAEKGTGRVTEVLLVIDATTGQNGLVQARQFADATQVTGVVLTKLDGSAKGGIVFAIETELSIPVKLVGLGETIGDLVAFDPDEFVDALFD
jgi:fused signal recognition particle receptor